MKNLLTTALMFVLAGAGIATPTVWEVGGEPFRGYASECGFPIIYRSTLAISEAVIDRNGKSQILLDPLLASDQEHARMQFLVAHECAHHRMKHAMPVSRRARRLSAALVRDQELSADCWAAELLARLGHERPIQIMIQRFHRAGLYSPGGGYPAGVHRASVIWNCAEQGRRLAIAFVRLHGIP